jgi:hypothetical protein
MCIKRSPSLIELRNYVLSKTHKLLKAILNFSRRFSFTPIGMDVEDDDFNKKKNRFWVQLVLGKDCV